MITTICLNPSFDRTVEMNSLKVGDVNRVRALREDMGGKGINVAVVAQRLGLDNIRVRHQDASVFVPEWEGQFDCVIADVPCSGLGIIRKKPDIR